MSTLFGNLTIFDNKDDISILNRRNTLCNDQGRSLFRTRSQALLDVLLGFKVNGRSGVIQNQNRRVHSQSTSQSQTLLLTTGETHTTLTNDGIVTVGQAAYKFIGIGIFSCTEDHIIGSIRNAVGDIRFNGIGEQEYILQGNTNVAAQILQVILLNFNTVYFNRACGRINKTGDQVQNRRLTGTGGAHNTNGGTGGNMHVDILQNSVAVESQGNMIQIDITLYFTGMSGNFGAYDFRSRFVQLTYTLAAYQEALGIINKETKLLHGAIQHPGQSGKDGQITNGDVTQNNKDRTDDDGASVHYVTYSFHNGRVGDPCLISL